MGVVISTFITIAGLLATGVLSSIAANKASKCSDARFWSIWSAVVSFLVAIIAFIIAVFLL